MLRKIRATIKANNLIKQGDSILIGLSGGADSVALTHALAQVKDELGIKLFTAHLNHGIRGDEAFLDEQFAAEFSKKLGIECFIKRVKIKEMAKGVSEELLGREERYSFFDELCKKHNINLIATAHNQNDNAETILMNLMRGATLRGLSGIPYQRSNIIRPLLDVSRNEIERYCATNNLHYVTDSTNLCEDYTRNKIRHSLLPLIEDKFNPNFISTLAENAAYFKEDNDLLQKLADDEYNKSVEDNCVAVSHLISLHDSISRRVIYKMIATAIGHSCNVSSKYVDAVLSLAKKQISGKSVDVSSGFEAIIEYDKLIIKEKSTQKTDFQYTLPLCQQIYVKEADLYIVALPAPINNGECFTIPQNAVIKVRNRRSGDVFFPSGMTGRKKVKDYFTDAKIPLTIRDKVCIITFDDEIGYIVGKRRDRRFDFDKQGIKILYSSNPINLQT